VGSVAAYLWIAQRYDGGPIRFAAPICDELGEQDRKSRALVPIASTNPQFTADLSD
jgi:hypothetical protein